MNLNKIDKSYIHKNKFYNNIEEFNSFFIKILKNKKFQENKAKIAYYLYKIATIVALDKRIFSPLKKEEFIQDTVYICFKRINCYKLGHFSNNPYGYFYKMIENHYKDILRKKLRRKNIMKFESLEAELEFNWPRNQPY